MWRGTVRAATPATASQHPMQPCTAAGTAHKKKNGSGESTADLSMSPPFIGLPNLSLE